MLSSRFSDLGLFELNVVDVVERNVMGAVGPVYPIVCRDRRRR
jgi:hypothetical protein